jgi:iron complex outermembrane receptor protein
MKYVFLPILLCITTFSFAQDVILAGKVTDARSGEAMIGVAINIDSTKNGAVTDVNGSYTITTSAGKHQLKISFVGYKTKYLFVDAINQTNKISDIQLEEDIKELGTVVISAGRFEQKIEDVTISMEVIKPQLVENKNTLNMETIIDQVPGVNMTDGQANIRSGSGYSYGAGSRVLLLVDDMPMLSADAGDVKWNYLPIENLEQIEVIKGASSALFGSSALNGVIHIRTSYPKDVPQTCINFSSGVYGDPKRESLRWWENANPIFTNAGFYHSRKIKNLDLVIGGNLFSDDGYRKLETEQRFRFNTNLRYRFKKIEGLSVGLNANHMNVTGGLFMLWQNADSAYYPQGGNIQLYQNYRTNIDPYVIYFTKKNGRHSLRSRFFRTNNLNDKEQSSLADLYYSEYQYQKRFKKEWVLTSGILYTYSQIKSDSLYGVHFGNNLAIYTQVDKKFNKLTLSFGARGEYYKIDTAETRFNIPLGKDTVQLPIYPVFRAGANYQIAKYSFLRASFGQGYRFPSIAEKFIQTSVSGLKIFPNTSLQPEHGWSTEIGIKQAIILGSWKGFVDLAIFRMEYKNMMEFNFGYHTPDSLVNPTPTQQAGYFGAKSINVSDANITGFEFSTTLQGKIGKIETTVFGGYTYTNPINADNDSAYKYTGTDTITGILKYRYKHNAKLDVQLDYKKISFGISARYNSFMQNIDKAFQQEILNDLFPSYNSGLYILPGIKEYREKYNKGDFVMDARLAYHINKNVKLSVIVNNILNSEYSSRPGDIMAPRNSALQVVIKF